MKQETMSRREFFRFSGAGGLLFLNGNWLFSEERLMAAADAVDHLLLGVSDLDLGIRWVEEQTGVKAVVGGVHPGMGTRNALLSMGGKRYLEIIAPDPQQETYKSRIDVRTLSKPRLIAWAAATNDIVAIAEQAQAAGFQVNGPFDGSRKKPDGTTLRWKIAFIPAAFSMDPVDPIPFFIQWAADSTHPSADSPQGCELESLLFEHPKSELLMVTLKNLGIEAKVNRAESAGLIATIRTPRGKIQFS